MKVLLSAYACLPNRGTEPGNGWGYATRLAARGITVHVLVPQDNQVIIENEIVKRPVPGLTFHFLAEGKSGLLRTDKIRYAAWQWFVLAAARRLHRREHFDVAHHVTYGSIHVPTLLWRLGIPVVFGPIGGGQTAPKSMLGYFGEAQRSEKLRTALTRVLHLSPWHRYCMSKMAATLVSNRDTERLCRTLGARRIEFVSDPAIPSHFLTPSPRTHVQSQQPLKLLWVGRLLPRKAIGLSLDMVARAQCNLTLTIVGYGISESTLRAMISDRGLNDAVIWEDRNWPWIEVQEMYSTHDAMLFTSLRDSCGVQLLEAMARGLPVITLDLHGAADFVPASAGFKISVDTPEQVIVDGAKTIERFSQLNSQQRTKMSGAAWEYAHGFTFEQRAEYFEQLYKTTIR